MEPLNENVRQLLDDAVASRGFHNISVQTEKGSFIGDNYLGIITKAKVSDGKDPSKTLNLIVKTATESPDFRRIIPLDKAFERELYFYNKVVPIYKTLLEEIGREPLDAFPGFLGGDYKQIPEVIIMDDMKSLGYFMKNRADPLNIDHVRSVMKTYGYLHGLYYVLKDRKPDVAKELAETMDETFFRNTGNKEMMASSFDLANDKVFKSFLPEDDELKRRFTEYTKDSYDTVCNLFEPEAADRHFVINHGDSWVNNMLFKYTDNQESSCPTKVCLLDFQLARYGSPAFDLSYFLFTCTDKKLRDEHYTEVLHLYHDSMHELLSWFSLDVDDFLPFDTLQEHIRKFSAFGLCMTISVMHLMLSDKDEIPDFQNMEIKENYTLEEMSTQFVYESKNEAIYKERIRGVIIDCVKHGIL